MHTVNLRLSLDVASAAAAAPPWLTSMPQGQQGHQGRR
jgi:hypothetical protein